MFCPTCGKQLADGSAFCDQCGASLAPAAQAAPQPTPVYYSAPVAAAAPVANADLKQKLKVPFLVTLIATVVLLLSVFLPYLSANKVYAEQLDAFGSEEAYPGSGITAKDLKDISLMEFASIANALDEIYSSSPLEGVAIVVYAIAALSAVAAVFAYFKKPIAVIIFTLLAYGATAIIELGITESGALNTKVYDFGIAHALVPLAVLASIVGSIWMIVVKSKAKKAQSVVYYPVQ